MSDQPVQPATPEQIATFKLGAAHRYQERGVTPQQADQLFTAHVEKIAGEMGLAAQPAPTDKVQKLAAALRTQLGC